MVTGDDLWADEDSRAEVHIGSAAIRLGAKTGITFLTLDDRTTQIRLAQGSLILRVRHVDDDDNYEVDTPNLAFTLLQPGEYRLNVNPDGNQTVITAWHGRGAFPAEDFPTPWLRISRQYSQEPTTWTMNSGRFPDRIISINGPSTAMTAKITPTRRTTFRAR